MYGTSYNYREFRKLMENLEDLGSKKWLDGREVFLCTNNMVSESITLAVSYRAKTLYDLVVRLHYLCMRYRCKVRFIHVSGTQMIDQRTYGISRGSLYKGFMNGKPILSLLHL